ncbi:hypothetical protein G6F70_004181 [Rhizopus microsporus]|uniref:Uncharacterized protein n=2 Tax=Rhizopus TaxID=4842 RepID=A0A367K521_RHIAZ|nr:hypothetical protein G6F71_002669 [Rhizopus microsporus]RCH97235.1 hypothetical protein CU097_009429 [Rhizopus azygosporus]KAG1200292.1 hypothetical protein G6F70_004181 [Rhizopus microsporus]KAG1214813.1 hypothetical protein G6F69_001573 [Rhizopus microsporus]KAG1233878.1 hypothetical protein G6F67_003954 [Rhizopus microsporus]
MGIGSACSISLISGACSVSPYKALTRDANAIEPSICNDLASLIYESPHRRLLASREYLELDDVTELLLNKDWMHESQVNFACAQVLAGAVLMNVSNGEATLVNTVKVYGGTKLAGIHRELPLSSSMSTSQLNQCMSTSGHTSEVQETVPKLALSRKLVLH